MNILSLRESFTVHWLIFIKDASYFMALRFNLREFNFVLVLAGELPNDFQRACLFFM